MRIDRKNLKTFYLLTIMLLLINIVLSTCLTDATILVQAQIGNLTPSSDDSLSWKMYMPIVKEEKLFPGSSRSYYIWNNVGLNYQGCLVAVDFACNQLHDNVFVFLGFGKPYRNSQMVYGTIQYNNTFASEDEIKADVISFSEGFYLCNNHQDNLVVSVGTNNSGGLITDSIANAHGDRWAHIVSDINSQLISISSSQNSQFPGIDGEVLAVGGIDVEPAYNPTYVTDHWFAGYNTASVTFRESVYVIGTADGCPIDFPTLDVQYPSLIDPALCANGWTQDDIYDASWGYTYSWPFPQIYAEDQSNAEQWRRIAIFAHAKFNRNMVFSGEMTQYESCRLKLLQDPNYTGCYSINNSPEDGFFQLYNRIAGDYRITEAMQWSSDIRYSGGY